jgi:hypothetical protein
MGIIFAQLANELPARHLVCIEPASTIAEAQRATRTAFKLPDDGGVLLSFGGEPLEDASATLGGRGVPADAILEAVRA